MSFLFSFASSLISFTDHYQNVKFTFKHPFCVIFKKYDVHADLVILCWKSFNDPHCIHHRIQLEEQRSSRPLTASPNLSLKHSALQSNQTDCQLFSLGLFFKHLSSPTNNEILSSFHSLKSATTFSIKHYYIWELEFKRFFVYTALLYTNTYMFIWTYIYFIIQ